MASRHRLCLKLSEIRKLVKGQSYLKKDEPDAGIGNAGY
jgi:hypothetical protein